MIIPTFLQALLGITEPYEVLHYRVISIAHITPLYVFLYLSQLCFYKTCWHNVLLIPLLLLCSLLACSYHHIAGSSHKLPLCYQTRHAFPCCLGTQSHRPKDCYSPLLSCSISLRDVAPLTFRPY